MLLIQHRLQHIIERTRPDNTYAQRNRPPNTEEEPTNPESVASPVAPSRASTEPTISRVDSQGPNSKDSKDIKK